MTDIGDILAGLERAKAECEALKTEDGTPPEFFDRMATLIVDGAKLANLEKDLAALAEKYCPVDTEPYEEPW